MKRIIVTVLLTLIVWLAYAAFIPQAEAQAVGASVFSHLSGNSPTDLKSEPYRGAYSDGEIDFYIIRFQPTGFILVAAEDQSIPILGYCTDNEFPPGEMPAHVKWYLDQYSRSMKEIRQNPDWSRDETWTAIQGGDYSSYNFTRNVPPLLSTTWDQDFPYNYYCPADAQGPGGRVYAGCVATAMAQIMKKWNFPLTGQGSHSYYATGYGQQTVNFGATTYNWAEMPNSIYAPNTHIATLIYHCGVSVNMNYSPNGSGANDLVARNAMINYFRFHSSAQRYSASSFPAGTWSSMLRNDLDLGRPIFYGGSGNDSAHAFVLDGYQGGNSFHFNWGWSGNYNGYFYLTNLNPGSHSFTQSQSGVLHLYPASQFSLTGMITSGGNPLPDATVAVRGTTHSGVSSYTGRYNISGVPAGTYQVSAGKPEYQTVLENNVVIEENNTTTLDFDLIPNYQPPNAVQAEESGEDLSLTWMEPDGDSAKRSVTGYKVWRLLQGEEYIDDQWILLSPDPIDDTAFLDTDWLIMPSGTFKWAVKALYADGGISIPAFSNAMVKITSLGTLAGFVRNRGEAPIAGAMVNLGDYWASTNSNGAYVIEILEGTYDLEVSHPRYSTTTQGGVVVVAGEIQLVNFQMESLELVLEEGFEAYPDFALDFDPWTLHDLDQSPTLSLSEFAFPNSGSPMAYIIFNPSQTVPPMTDNAPHSGQKMAACFPSTNPANNDWLISPQLTGGGNLRFWARSYPDKLLGRFNVGLSTTGTDPIDFTIISGDGYVEAPLNWTEYTYDLSAHANQEIYLGIQCISDDWSIFMVDDVSVSDPVSAEDGLAPTYATGLGRNYPNPFNPRTTIAYSVKEASPVSLEIFNVKGQLVQRLVNETKAAGHHSAVWSGQDREGRTLPSGIYYLRMKAGKYSAARKMVLMK